MTESSPAIPQAAKPQQARRPQANPSKWRRRWRRVAVLAALLVVVGWWVGCTSLVRPPSSPADPVRVFVLRNALHRGLVVPGEDLRHYVEFAFGEWEWYVQQNTSWYRVVPTMLWPTTGGLGTRRVSATSEAELRDELSYAELVPIVVERDAVDSLRADLLRRWERGLEAADGGSVHSYGIEFVHADESYTAFHNCADAVAVWLERLGCAVSWLPIRVDLEVAE